MDPDFKYTLQAGILKGHGRSYSKFYCFRFRNTTGRDKNKIIEWVKAIGGHVTSHARQEHDTKAYKICGASDHSVINMYLSNSFFTELELRPIVKFDDTFFLNGMLSHNYADKRVLRDYKHKQLLSSLGNLVILISIANNKQSIIDQEFARLKKATKYEAIKDYFRVYEMTGHRIGGRQKSKAKGPLAFRDGVAQHVVSTEQIIKTALIPEDTVKKHFGSLLVFRVLRTYADSFEELIDEITEKYAYSREYAAALIMGRFKNGTPLINYNREVNFEVLQKNKTDVFFDYQADKRGGICPYSAHIRAMNKRDEKSTETSLIIRRGMHYFDSLTESNEPEQGLVFMSFQKSIADQFVKMLSNFEEDNLIYKESSWSFPTQRGSQERGEPVKLNGNNKKLVYLRGGEFFYCPSLYFLRNIDQYIQQSPPVSPAPPAPPVSPTPPAPPTPPTSSTP